MLSTHIDKWHLTLHFLSHSQDLCVVTWTTPSILRLGVVPLGATGSEDIRGQFIPVHLWTIWTCPFFSVRWGSLLITFKNINGQTSTQPPCRNGRPQQIAEQPCHNYGVLPRPGATQDTPYRQWLCQFPGLRDQCVSIKKI